MIPGPLELVVLVAAVYRLTRLVGWDDLPPIQRARNRLTGALELPNLSDPELSTWTFRRPTLAHFLACPFCVGFWLSLAAYGAWLSAPRLTLYAMTPLAISGAVGLIAKNLDE